MLKSSILVLAVLACGLVIPTFARAGITVKVELFNGSGTLLKEIDFTGIIGVSGSGTIKDGATDAFKYSFTASSHTNADYSDLKIAASGTRLSGLKNYSLRIIEMGSFSNKAKQRESTLIGGYVGVSTSSSLNFQSQVGSNFTIHKTRVTPPPPHGTFSFDSGRTAYTNTLGHTHKDNNVIDIFENVGGTFSATADTLTMVPEPATILLSLIGIPVLGFFVLRRKAS